LSATRKAKASLPSLLDFTQGTLALSHKTLEMHHNLLRAGLKATPRLLTNNSSTSLDVPFTTLSHQGE
jgi:hypothetical protein